VTGLAESGGRLAGVHVDGGVVDADIVVDAAGRRSPLPGWLAAKGRPVPERSSPCGLTYYSRFWVLHRTGDPGDLNCGGTAGGSFDRYSCHVFPADNGTFSVTYAVPSDDPDLGELRSPEAFDAAAARIPSIARWTDSSVAVPISGVAAMSGLENRLRMLAPSGAPVLPGLLAVGDAGCTTDPAHSRGLTLALESALACARAVAEHGADQSAVAAAADAAQQEVLAPWFDDSVVQDDARLCRWSPEQAKPNESPTDTDAVSHADAALAAQRDPEVWAAFVAMQNLLRRPREVLAEHEIGRRVRTVLDGPWRPEPTEGISRDELAATVRLVTARRPARVPG
jgi:flavin-dependent dehydrogenase